MRRNVRPLHATTSATSSGLGKHFAGSAASDACWMPDSTPWSEGDAVASNANFIVLPAPQSVALELERARVISTLRSQFRDGCRNAMPHSAPPLSAIERWLLLCKWHEAAEDTLVEAMATEPLLPATAVATAADSSLVSDLCRAGMDESAAAALTADLRAFCISSATAFADACREGRMPAAPPVEMQPHGDELWRLRCTLPGSAALFPKCTDGPKGRDAAGDAHCSGGESGGGSDSDNDEGGGGEGGRHDESRDDEDLSVIVTSACIEKLRVFYARQHRIQRSPNPPRPNTLAAAASAPAATTQHAPHHLPARDMPTAAGVGSATAEWTPATEADFRARLYACLLRYRSVGGLGFQAGLGGSVLCTLQVHATHPTALASLRRPCVMLPELLLCYPAANALAIS